MDSARCSGPYEKIPPALGNNQIDGFVEFFPLTSGKKDKLTLFNISLTLYRKAYTTWITYNAVFTYLQYNTITYDTSNANAYMITHVAYND